MSTLPSRAAHRSVLGLSLLGLLAACSGTDGTPVIGAAQTSDPGSGATSSTGAGSGSTAAPPSSGSGSTPAPSYDAGAPTPPSSPAPTGGGTSAPDGGSDAGAPPAQATTEYAPYFPTWTWGSGGYAYSSLVDLQQKAGVNAVTIAFVLSSGGCAADQGIEQNLDDVKAFTAAGGHVKASFGGADGTYVEAKCSSAAALAKALTDFVDATGITDLDFDVEQDPVLTDTVNDMRGKALKIVQDARQIRVAFTLAANAHSSGSEGGLTTQGQSVVSHAVQNGVTVSHVNLMTMDYGDSFAGQPLAPVAIGSLNDAHTQLMKIVPGITAAQGWQMIGVIPMIGKNDDAEVFSLDDAKTLAAFAKTNAVGLVSFWSIDRDRVCPKGGDFNSCSTVETSNFAFNAILKTAAE